MESQTLGDEDITLKIRSDLPDQSAATLPDRNVSNSDLTIKGDDQNTDQDLSSSPTIQLPQEILAEANSSDDDEWSFETDNGVDFEESEEPAIGPEGKTLLVDPMQTMARPLNESRSTTLPQPQTKTRKQPSTVKPPDGPKPQTAVGQRLPTIVNPQAALEAAEEYSKGLQSLIPPRTIVQKEHVSDSSDYQILKRIGSGAYGTVFRAKQVPLERSVAIKLLQNSNEDEYNQQRIKNEFLREAQFTGRLEHPNIVPIHDIGLTVSPKGQVNPFYVMKEIRGTSWLSEIRTKPLKDNLEVLKNVTNAIAFAHSQNILHCDLKPDNVMLGEFGEVLVVDWGQAVDLSVPETMRPGGTPAYIAPEMAQYWIDIYLDYKEESPSESDVGVRSDVYLLGALLFEIVAGTAPHCKSTKEPPYEVIRRAAANHIVDYPETVNENLMNIALRTLRATDGDHIESTSDLLAAIDQYETRSLSIELRQRAQKLLKQAKAEADYDHFQRARFGFEEALEKWEGNEKAREGLRDAKLSCAELAREDQNFDLGLDVLEGVEGEAETELRKQLTDGKRVRDRRKRLVARLAIGLAGSILLGILINAYMIDKNLKSVKARDEAEIALTETEIELTDAENLRDDAEAARVKADGERAKADGERAKAVDARNNAVKVQKQAEVAVKRLTKQTKELGEEKQRIEKEKVELEKTIKPMEKKIKVFAVELTKKELKVGDLEADIETLGQQKETLTEDKQNLEGTSRRPKGILKTACLQRHIDKDLNRLAIRGLSHC